MIYHCIVNILTFGHFILDDKSQNYEVFTVIIAVILFENYIDDMAFGQYNPW